MTSLNSRIDRLRSTRVALRKNIQDAWRIADVGDRAQAVQARKAALHSTQAEWDSLMAEAEARSDRVELAQLKHQRTRPAAAPVRRSVPTAGYITKIVVPGR